MDATVSKTTPSSERASTTATPRPACSGRRTRYANQTVPSASKALGAPAQFPGPEPGGSTTTVERANVGTSDADAVSTADSVHAD
jgi:hypothetical protein